MPPLPGTVVGTEARRKKERKREEKRRNPFSAFGEYRHIHRELEHTVKLIILQNLYLKALYEIFSIISQKYYSML